MTRVLVLLLLVLSPLAAADHVFSHRFVVEGRVLGGNGLPVPGVLVDVTVTGSEERFVSPCQELQRPVTDEWGDFRYCYHVHEVGRGGVVRVAAGNATQSRPVDADLRRMAFDLKDESAAGVEPEGWARTFHVRGRVWERGLTRLEGVNVSGVAMDHVPVEVSTVNATRAEGNLSKGSTFDLSTDGFGDYAGIVRLLEGERPEDVVLAVRTRNATRSTTLHSEFHRVTMDFALPFEAAGEGDPVGPRPGSSSGPVSAWMLLAGALALLGAVAFARKKG